MLLEMLGSSEVFRFRIALIMKDDFFLETSTATFCRAVQIGELQDSCRGVALVSLSLRGSSCPSLDLRGSVLPLGSFLTSGSEIIWIFSSLKVEFLLHATIGFLLLLPHFSFAADCDLG